MSPRKRRGSAARPNAHMTIASRAFTPTANRRLNELIGFLMLVFAVLLVLALVSYSPLDPSLNTASTPPASRPAHNWIGVVGAIVSDLALQLFGVAVFLVPVFLVLYSLRWFRSRPISCSLRQDARRGGAGDVSLRLHRAAAVEHSLEGSHPVRRTSGPHRRRRADSLLQPGRRLSGLPGGDRGGPVSFDGVFLRSHPDLVADAVRASPMRRSTALPTGESNAPARRPPRSWRRSALPPPMPSR